MAEKAARTTASAFLAALIKAVSCQIHTVLADNDIAFRSPPLFANGPAARAMTHMLDRRRRENGIDDHRLAKINHPWTNGLVKRMNRTIKDATVKRFHSENHDRLQNRLQDFIDACNVARRLKPLKGFAPYEFIRKQ